MLVPSKHHGACWALQSASFSVSSAAPVQAICTGLFETAVADMRKCGSSQTTEAEMDRAGEQG